MKAILLFLSSLSAGYLLCSYFTNPPRNKKRLPNVRFRNVEVLPNLKVHFRRKTYHFHHWFILTILTGATLLIYEGIQHLMVMKAAAIGGILQGLRFPDRFKFRHPRKL